VARKKDNESRPNIVLENAPRVERFWGRIFQSKFALLAAWPPNTVSDLSDVSAAS